MAEETPPRARVPSLRTIAMPADANPGGDIFGGWIMSQMDLAGAIHASYRVVGRIVTVAVESMKFHLPVYVGDQVSCFCDTRKIGTTSISVHIETWVRRRQQHQEYLKVTEATYTYVSIGENRKPVPVQLRESGEKRDEELNTGEQG
ncbi:MAG: acyl-CoA thioesterase [Gammaproteobacteria bacterium]|nr:acyl-CoA thioesterase [Gammaproteobacteria bacterium]MCY4226780.1 acyl-CoA thioesterase [Gammaproteobacteria bacterium]